MTPSFTDVTANTDMGTNTGTAAKPDPEAVSSVSTPLKIFVIGSAIAIVIGSVILVTLIIARAMGGADTPAPIEPAPGAPIDLALPAGARIVQVTPEGKRLVLLLEDAKGQQYLSVIDGLTGERLSLIQVRPEG